MPTTSDRGARIQTALFEPADGPRVPPLLGNQADIRYFAASPRTILNSPAATGMAFWSINPYVGCAFGCAYCYARFAHRYTSERLSSPTAPPTDLPSGAEDDLPAWLAFERRILVKREAGALVRSALRRPARLGALQREPVVIGTATDPYQPAERQFRVTRGVLEALAEHRGLAITIITKSPLVTRDIDLLVRIAERSEISVHMSLITVDRELARKLEPRAPTPLARLRAMGRLRQAGIEVGVNVMPVLPGITDQPRMIDALVQAVAKANVSYVGACALRLRRTARDRYLPFIDVEFPQLADKYRRAYAGGHQVSKRYRDGLRTQFHRICERHGVQFGHYYESEHEDSIQSDSLPSSGGDAPIQLALALEGPAAEA